MRIALIADTFPPMKSSGAVQIRDLSREFARQGHSLCVLIPATDQFESWKLDNFNGAQVLRLKAPKTKDIGYVRRTLAELVTPFFMLHNFRKSPLRDECWDGVVWYSPSIFHGPFVSFIKRKSACKSYLIIRDIFPNWAVDMGLITSGSLIHRFFSAVALYQYSVANVIGVQAPGNKKYFTGWDEKPGRKLEVLQNWLEQPAVSKCSIRINETALAGRKIFVYAGNMGIAQGLDILLDLADELRFRRDIGFLMVGRGSRLSDLINAASARQLDNMAFFDEIHPDEIPALYAQCAAGIVTLDRNHKSHNIPGKFLTYMQSGLPVLANINSGNDLSQMIRKDRVGQVCESNLTNELRISAERLLDQIENDANLRARCKALFEREFLVENTVKQVTLALSVTEGEP